MKVLAIVFSLFVSSTVFGQLNSYSDNKNEIRMMLDIVFMTSDEGVLILKGKEDYGYEMKLQKDQSKLESTRGEALEEAGCNGCEVFETKETSSPVNYVIDEMEEGDVFVITKKSSLYLVELYRKE